MKNLIKSKKNVLLFYSFSSFVLTILSLLFLFANIWEVHVVLFIGTVFNGLYLFLILFWGDNKNDKRSLDKPFPMFLFALLRIIVELVGLFLSGLMMYLIPSKIFVTGNTKLQFLFVLLYLIPYTIALVLFVLNKSKEN